MRFVVLCATFAAVMLPSRAGAQSRHEREELDQYKRRDQERGGGGAGGAFSTLGELLKGRFGRKGKDDEDESLSFFRSNRVSPQRMSLSRHTPR